MGLDLSENRSLGYVLDDGFWISKVDRKIMAIGSNELHIVVKRMDDKSNTTQYYYIVKSEDEGQSHLSPAIKGPYSLEEFNAINQSIKLPSFTSEFQ